MIAHKHSTTAIAQPPQRDVGFNVVNTKRLENMAEECDKNGVGRVSL